MREPARRETAGNGEEGIGVVVMDYDQPAMTSRCLAGLAEGKRTPDHVVLICNGDDDGSRIAIPATVPITVISPNCNLGCAGGRNMGLKWLYDNTDLASFMLLDNDAVSAPHLLERVAADPPIPSEVLAPVIFDSDGGDVWSSGGTIAVDGSITQLTNMPENGCPVDVDWAPGACLIIHRDAWTAIGHFDEGLDFLFEDIDWCCRFTASGGRMRVRPDLRVTHTPHQTLGGRWSPERVRLWARNGTIFLCTSVRSRPRHLGKWLSQEARLVVRDFRRGQRRWATARLRGLWEGCVDSARRRLLPP